MTDSMNPRKRQPKQLVHKAKPSYYLSKKDSYLDILSGEQGYVEYL